MLTVAALPVERLEAHWIEQLGSNYEVIRVLCCAGKFLYRVVPHKARSWRAERRELFRWGPQWIAIKQAPRGKYKATPERSWRSPEAAMRAVEALVDITVSHPQREGEKP